MLREWEVNGDIRMQVRLSPGSTKLPSGQDSTHLLLESTKPGRHWVHANLSMVEACVNPGIPHVVHFAGHAKEKTLKQDGWG